MPGVRTESLRSVEVRKDRFDIYQWLIDRVFSPMTLGRLTIELTSGEKLVYGSGQGGVEADIRLNNHDFFKKCVLYGDVGFGESYVDGDWETDDIAKVVEWMILNVENNPILMDDKEKKSPVNFLKIANKLYHTFRNNSIKGSQKNISDHYDLGNDFFRLFLDPSMMYSSAYFKDPRQSLEEAQAVKNDELCRKLKLTPMDRVLEIGSGWGGFSIYAAKNYGAHITTITISQEQYEYARKRIFDEKLNDKVEIKLMDYRQMKGRFDKIISIEMIEAIGDKFLPVYFEQCQDLLAPHGLLGLQMILSPDHRYDSFRKNVDWIQKHIFPGSLLPSMRAIMQAISKTGTLVIHDYEDMTQHYVKTLSMWRENFNQNIDKVTALGFDRKFIRKWNYYWCYCEAAFKMRNISVAQAVFTRPNNFKLHNNV